MKNILTYFTLISFLTQPHIAFSNSYFSVVLSNSNSPRIVSIIAIERVEGDIPQLSRKFESEANLHLSDKNGVFLHSQPIFFSRDKINNLFVPNYYGAKCISIIINDEDIVDEICF